MMKGYSPGELAATGVLGGRTKIYGLINAGLLRARKHGKRTIILDEDVRACVERFPLISPKADAPPAKSEVNTPERSGPSVAPLRATHSKSRQRAQALKSWAEAERPPEVHSTSELP